MGIDFKEDSIREWILNTQDKETIADVVLHGCQGGTISELIYYTDTVAFYEKYKNEIWDRLWNTYEEFGFESVLHFIASFHGANDVGSDDQFSNLLAWYACEEVCREIMRDEERDLDDLPLVAQA